MASGPLRSEASCVRPLCRNFARGSCRWGKSCRFSHERESARVCAYFQREVCRYEEQCSYQHIQEEPAPVGIQHGLMPHQEPGTEPTATDQAQGGAQGTSVHPACSMTCVSLQFQKLEVKVEEKDKKNIPALDNVPSGAILCGKFVPTKAQDASGFQPQGPAPDPDSSDRREAVVEMAAQTDPEEVPAEPGAAAALVTSSSVSLRAQSEAVVCGICMDRVYGKAQPQQRLFGILPNCSHAYCVGCICRWRRSSNFESDVVRACPECRITSNFYIPYQYWISDAGEKERLIRIFKARAGKISCKLFFHGHCPFGSECIYLHKTPARRPWRHLWQWPRMPSVFIPSSSSSSSSTESFGEEDDEGFDTMAMLAEEFSRRPSREILRMLLFHIVYSAYSD